MAVEKEERPKGARKVPGYKVWMEEDGQPWGTRGKMAVWTERGCPYVNATKDEGGKRLLSVAGMMQATWMTPKPEGAHRVHLDGNPLNNSASNLGWAQRRSAREYREKWAANLLEKMQADESHPKHGTKLGYDSGCRCARCKAATRLARRMSQTRKLLRVMGVEPWAGPR